MLKILTECDGVSGNEDAVREIIRREAMKYADKITVDPLGNLICEKRGAAGAKTVLLSAHMDEVGFIVTKITEDGYLRFDTVGGIDTKILLSQKVKINNLSGVISFKAIHLQSKEEREKMFSINDLFIDIGAKSKEEAEKFVTVGDYCTFDSNYFEQGDMIKAKALDDRAGCAILLEMLKKETKVNLICFFVTCEEIGLRGARAAISGYHPDFAIVAEGTTCNDLTGVPDEQRVTKFGGGAAISVMDYSSKASDELIEILTGIAKKSNIPWQFKASVRGGNDAGAISLAHGGIKTASISVPCRYIHSPVSAMNKKDFYACRDLIGKFLEYAGEI